MNPIQLSGKLLFLFLLLSGWYSFSQLTCPELLVPLNNSTNSPAFTLVQWTDIPAAIGYEVSMGTSPFENDILEQQIYTDNFTEQIDFPPNSTIYVVIIPFSNTQFAVGCEQLSFTTTSECAFFINPVTDISVCFAPNENLNTSIDFDSIETNLIEAQEGLTVTYFDASSGEPLNLNQFIPEEEQSEIVVTARATDEFECFKEVTFSLILLRAPELEIFQDVRECISYVLPSISAPNEYNTQIDGSGIRLEIGDEITTSQTIYVIAREGSCENQTSFTVTIDPSICDTPDYPKFFTPNGDGINDLWHLSESSVSSLQNSPIYIYNRFGKLIYQLDDDSLGWDGNYKGAPLPASDYWFFVKLDSNTMLKGHFALKR